MTWWLWLIVALAVYLLVTLTPWILLQVAIWRIRRRLPFLSTEAQQLERLVLAEQEHTEHWPLRPRPGRYEPVDRTALDQLTRLRIIISEINDLWPALADYEAPFLSLAQLLTLAAWRPLLQALRVWRVKRRLDALLHEGERTVNVLTEQWAEARSIPGRIEAELSDVRNEVSRLQALWEDEVQAGLRGLDALGRRLRALDATLGEALAALRASEAGQVAGVALQAESQLAQAIEASADIERELRQAIEMRRQALEGLERLQAGLRALEERWQQLQAEGARDPAVAQRVAELRTLTEQLLDTAQQATPAAYAEALAGLEAHAAQQQSLSEQLDALAELMRRSQEALAGDVGALAAAHQTCDELHEASGVALDLSEAHLAQAQEIYAQAETQLALGTWHGYQTALALAEQAREATQQAVALAERAAQQAEQLRAQWQESRPEVRQALRARADAAGAGLQAYTRHWDQARQAELERVATLLQQADAAWESLPEPVRLGQAPPQSELAATADRMQQLRGAVRRAQQLVEELEGRLARVQAQRRALEEGLAQLEGELAPALANALASMLPELRERCDAWFARYQRELPELRDPKQIDYDEASDRWLPQTLAEAREMLDAHREDTVRLRRQAVEAAKRLEREWQRLQKLEPLQRPLPEESPEQLTADYEAWQSDLEAQADSPLALSELVGRRAAALERRMETARRQINEGRQALAALDRQYLQQLQAIDKSRAALRALVQDSQWRHVLWNLNDGESLVERATAYQEASRQAESFDEAVNQMQRAVNSVQEALQVYAGVEQQLRSAQERLNREFRAANADLDRAQRQCGQLRQQGASEALRALEARCATATSLISMAQSATSFEEALRYLREAQEELARG